jgi:hypothetical protein
MYIHVHICHQYLFIYKIELYLSIRIQIISMNFIYAYAVGRTCGAGPEASSFHLPMISPTSPTIRIGIGMDEDRNKDGDERRG